jgi:hypothetical protein
MEARGRAGEEVQEAVAAVVADGLRPRLPPATATTSLRLEERAMEEEEEEEEEDPRVEGTDPPLEAEEVEAPGVAGAGEEGE